MHEVTSPQAFEGLRLARRSVRRPDCTLLTVDHNVPTDTDRSQFDAVDTCAAAAAAPPSPSSPPSPPSPSERPAISAPPPLTTPRLGLFLPPPAPRARPRFIEEVASRTQVLELERNVVDFGMMYFGMADARQGIVHVVGPEQGFTLPGTTCVCGDSHTATHGAFGALAFGIGTSEVEHLLATQTLPQAKGKNLLIRVDGSLGPGVTSKDIVLHVCGLIGTAGGTGCVIEFAGQAIRELSMEARMSISNMAIEAGARAGVIAPDDVTFEYIKGRPMAPRPDSQEWEDALANWRALASDEGAVYEAGEIIIDADDIAPTVTWGTSPQASAARPRRAAGEPARASREAKRALLAARALGFADSERARRTSRARAPLLRSRAPQDTTSILGHVPVPDDPSQGGSDDPARVAGIKRSLECVPRVARARRARPRPIPSPSSPPSDSRSVTPAPLPLSLSGTWGSRAASR